MYQLQNEQTQNTPEALRPEVDILDTGLEYTNEEYGIEFRYPEGWEISDPEWSSVITLNPRGKTYQDRNGVFFHPIAIVIDNIGEWEFTVGIKRKGEEVSINNLSAYRIVGYKNKVQYWFEHPTKDFHFSVENRVPIVVSEMDITPQERAELEQAFELVLFSFSMTD